MLPYRSNVVEESSDIANDPVNITVFFNEAVAFAICHLAYHIESVELQPPGEIARLICRGVKFLSLGEEELSGVVDKWLVLNKC